LSSVIRAGGSGTRFGPASRIHHPKHLLPICTKRPLVEETLDRISHLLPPEQILVVTNAGYAQMTRDLLSELPPGNVIGEPVGRDTAACIGLAALILHVRDEDAVMAVMPSDQIIKPAEEFCNSLSAAADHIKKHPGALIAFGIKPTFPATGYGYIKRGKALKKYRDVPFFAVDAFKEKPDGKKAEAFLNQGGFYWNAGIFIWRADTILDLMERFLPDLHAGLMRIKPVVDRPRLDDVLDSVYPGLQKISIDYGIMEKAEERVVAEVSFDWDDVGSWKSLERWLRPDEANNFGDGDYVCIEAENNIVSAHGGVVGLIGVEGLIVVHTPDATLVCRKEEAEAVKELVLKLKQEYK
ncbi:MAG: mannose-1-phosphate guanylyltransferase, partial [Planctomycetota bacterium]